MLRGQIRLDNQKGVLIITAPPPPPKKKQPISGIKKFLIKCSVCFEKIRRLFLGIVEFVPKITRYEFNLIPKDRLKDYLLLVMDPTLFIFSGASFTPLILGECTLYNPSLYVGKCRASRPLPTNRHFPSQFSETEKRWRLSYVRREIKTKPI